MIPYPTIPYQLPTRIKARQYHSLPSGTVGVEMRIHCAKQNLVALFLVIVVVAVEGWIGPQPYRPSDSRRQRHLHQDNCAFITADSLSSQTEDKTPTFSITTEPRGKAFPQQTPHSGRHFVSSHPAQQRQQRRRDRFGLRRRGRQGRFMEGWYYRLTTHEGSFAIILSIEDAGNPKSNLTLACIQIVGPNDTYLVQADEDDSKFWAWKEQQGLGCNFVYNNEQRSEYLQSTTTAMTPEVWDKTVQSGFQILPNRFQGKIHGHDGSMGGVKEGQGVPGTCHFDFSVTPLCGWGDTDKPQKRTGGWLSRFAIFERTYSSIVGGPF